MIIEFSESDILSSKIVNPAWYRVHIESVEDRTSKDGQSTNSWIKGKIVFDADSGSKEFSGVATPYLWLFNSKGAFAAVGFCACLGMEPGAGKRADLSNATGKDLDVFIGNLLVEGTMRNVITGQYRAPRS